MSPLLTNFVYERAQESTLQEKKQKSTAALAVTMALRKKGKKNQQKIGS